jgi:probable rRNA maturation factor
VKSSRSAPVDVNIVNQTASRLPKKFLIEWVGRVIKELKRRKVSLPSKTRGNKSELVIAFVGMAEMKRLNKTFRRKNRVTDILSFEGEDENSLGELVICLDVIRTQAAEHGLSMSEELGYMILHGVLHLLGYEHEKSASKAKRMFSLQDEIFEKLR